MSGNHPNLSQLVRHTAYNYDKFTPKAVHR